MDHAAFRAFYEKTVPKLRAFVIRSCGSVDVADDILQEAFLRFLQSAPMAKLDESQKRAYLYRTVESLIVNQWHRRQRDEKIRRDASVGQNKSRPDPIADEMSRAFASLDPRHRTLLWMAYVEGYDHKEIAAATKVGEKSVRVLLFRARQLLLKVIGKQ